eukprot:CAMPEP_0113504530 /NCGR_PEP_ID=MMETSP0014_2-20120614/34764_1 /TAXON_ID=2857 /ORGANISM="Nitzschia sp." /LENGTH=486 /DNA_ID=CAMNT_0000399645 /DNA_START=377 /DNA_END=1833 /DNA_ORIENTATION=- /assembly_acc=CAM_ASM_000159
MLLTPYQNLDTSTTTSRPASSSSSSSPYIKEDKMELVPPTTLMDEDQQRRQQKQQQLEDKDGVGCNGSKMIKLEEKTSPLHDAAVSSPKDLYGAIDNNKRRKRVTRCSCASEGEGDDSSGVDAYLASASSSSSSTCNCCFSDAINIPNFRRVSGINAKVNFFRSAAPESWLAAQIKKEQQEETEEQQHQHQHQQNATASYKSSKGAPSASSTGQFALHHVKWFIDLRFADGTEGGLCYKEDLDTMLSYNNNQSPSSSSSSESDDDDDTGIISPIASTWLPKSTDASGTDSPTFDPPIFGETNRKQQQQQKQQTKSNNKKRWYLTFLGDGTDEGKYSQTTAFDYMHRAWSSSPSSSTEDSSSSTSADDGCSTSTSTSSNDDKKSFGLEHLSARGLTGLNEVLLFHNMPMIRTVLQTLTLIWETYGPETNILVYCTLGKDRTGVVVALCQYLLGVSIEDIGKEYELSTQWYDFSWQRLHEHFHGRVDP